MKKITIEADGVVWTIDQFIDAYAYIRVPDDHDWVIDGEYYLRGFSIPIIILRKNGSLHHGFSDQLDMTDVIAWRCRDFIGEPRICIMCLDYCLDDEFYSLIFDYSDGKFVCAMCEEQGEP